MYGNFKSLGRAARRGHVAERTTAWGQVLLFRKIKSDKVGASSEQHKRHIAGAMFLNSGLTTNGAKMVRLWY
jgi:hypothetical protein